jgi:hypothetical protein
MTGVDSLGTIFIAYRELDVILHGLEKSERKEVALTYEEAKEKSKTVGLEWVWYEFQIDHAGERFEPKKIGVIDNA